MENENMSRASCCAEGGNPGCKKSRHDIKESNLIEPKAETFLLNHARLCKGGKLSKFRESKADTLESKQFTPKTSKLEPAQA